jgi:hypothetical protein
MRVQPGPQPYRKTAITLVENYSWAPDVTGDLVLNLPTYALGQPAWLEVYGYGVDDVSGDVNLAYQVYGTMGIWETLRVFFIDTYRGFAYTFYLGPVPHAGRLVFHTDHPGWIGIDDLTVKLIV